MGEKSQQKDKEISEMKLVIQVREQQIIEGRQEAEKNFSASDEYMQLKNAIQEKDLEILQKESQIKTFIEKIAEIEENEKKKIEAESTFYLYNVL